MAFQVSHIPYSSCLSSKLRSVPRGDPELQCLECARLHVTPNRANQCHPGPNPIVAERAETQRYLENWKATSNALTWHRVKPIVLNQMKHNFDSIYLCVCVCVLLQAVSPVNSSIPSGSLSLSFHHRVHPLPQSQRVALVCRL